MGAKTIALLVVAQIVLLIVYVPMTFELHSLAYEHLAFELFRALPVRLLICVAPAVVALSPILYGAMKARGVAGPIGMFVVAYAVTAIAAWEIIDPHLTDVLIPLDVFAPVMLPVLLMEAASRALGLAAVALAGALIIMIVAVNILRRTRKPKLVAALLPATFGVTGWLIAELAFGLWLPHAATTQFGRTYCMTYLGSAFQSTRYGLGPSPYRHAEVTTPSGDYHWSFKAGAYVPEDHWGSSANGRTCAAGSQRSRDYPRQ